MTFAPFSFNAKTNQSDEHPWVEGSDRVPLDGKGRRFVRMEGIVVVQHRSFRLRISPEGHFSGPGSNTAFCPFLDVKLIGIRAIGRHRSSIIFHFIALPSVVEVTKQRTHDCYWSVYQEKGSSSDKDTDAAFASSVFSRMGGNYATL